MKSKKTTLQRFRFSLLIVVILLPLSTYTQESLPKNEKKTVITSVKELIDSNYVMVNLIETINHSLDSIYGSGKYSSISKQEDFAKTLTEDLVKISKDKHFKVQYNPELIQSRREWFQRQQEQLEEDDPDIEGEQENESDEEYIDWNFWYAEKENFGFEKVEILDGNIGYVKLTFWQPLDWVRATMDATMGFVANTDALIIDLTENQGGYSPSDSYLGSYFFEENPIKWTSSFNRPLGETTDVFTFQEIGGNRYLNKPIFILVSEETFSLAEQFAYSMKHFKKAIIVGQNTAGAAHAIDFIEINDNFAIQLPIVKHIHPVTKTDWEGIGVIPHRNAKVDEALKVAYLAALDKLLVNTEYDKLKEKYSTLKKEVNNSKN
ncbi:S41 family peptidase [Flagellimonas sp. S174]|uniref:S41 family peptidase n=1 Tax=Flagellimonas sp. S174 TaxID=3410790 RepID=UPI003BF48F8C